MNTVISNKSFPWTTLDIWLGFSAPFYRVDYIRTCLFRQIKGCHTGTKAPSNPVTVYWHWVHQAWGLQESCWNANFKVLSMTGPRIEPQTYRPHWGGRPTPGPSRPVHDLRTKLCHYWSQPTSVWRWTIIFSILNEHACCVVWDWAPHFGLGRQQPSEEYRYSRNLCTPRGYWIKWCIQ